LFAGRVNNRLVGFVAGEREENVQSSWDGMASFMNELADEDSGKYKREVA
jgi:hypothetical protein